MSWIEGIGGSVDASSLCEAVECTGDYDKEGEEEVSRWGTSFFVGGDDMSGV